MCLGFAAQIHCETMGDSQSWCFWEQGWHCQEPVGMWVVTKPHVTSMCMDMTLQEILESCLACAYFSGQQKQGINALPLSKMRNLNKEVLLDWRLGKILPVDFAAKLLVTQWLIPKLWKQLFLAAIKASKFHQELVGLMVFLRIAVTWRGNSHTSLWNNTPSGNHKEVKVEKIYWKCWFLLQQALLVVEFLVLNIMVILVISECMVTPIVKIRR